MFEMRAQSGVMADKHNGGIGTACLCKEQFKESGAIFGIECRGRLIGQ